MNPMKSICEFMAKADASTKKDGEGAIGTAPSDKLPEATEKSRPRDGMSDESAKFLIGKCTDNMTYKVYGLANKGRYFTARVLDSKGHVINDLLVDKLNGNVKFIR